jgi:hypothetical protein
MFFGYVCFVFMISELGSEFACWFVCNVEVEQSEKSSCHFRCGVYIRKCDPLSCLVWLVCVSLFPM